MCIEAIEAPAFKVVGISSTETGPDQQGIGISNPIIGQYNGYYSWIHVQKTSDMGIFLKLKIKLLEMKTAIFCVEKLHWIGLIGEWTLQEKLSDLEVIVISKILANSV